MMFVKIKHLTSIRIKRNLNQKVYKQNEVMYMVFFCFVADSGFFSVLILKMARLWEKYSISIITYWTLKKISLKMHDLRNTSKVYHGIKTILIGNELSLHSKKSRTVLLCEN